MPSLIKNHPFFGFALSMKWGLDTQITCLCDFIDLAGGAGRLRTVLWARVVSGGTSVERASELLPAGPHANSEELLHKWRASSGSLRRQCLDPLIVAIISIGGADALMDHARAWSPSGGDDMVFGGMQA
ncbi:hypothetical protein [Alcanivorax sp. 1008]|uniref:hypothetical protein n=1 Tax=Alcanivorax sp. 1008 TaxID=2816853 RepID=UPI001D1CC85E|nr:hypothetical protein [Alcanivorax sp. 1008]MCC1496886.1 hypothetical protein [Alcanivorax sp. 1008]